MTVLLEYRDFGVNFSSQILPILRALCLMLLASYYATNQILGRQNQCPCTKKPMNEGRHVVTAITSK